VEWPLFDLVLACGPVTLRPVTDAMAEELAAAVPDDLELDPRQERFPGLHPARDRQRRIVQGLWTSRASWSPSSWCLDLGVELDGRLVGGQSLEGDDFGALRTVDTASWLVPSVRGRGVGTSRIRTERGVEELRHVRLTAEVWAAAGHRVEVSGVEPCLPWFGVAVSVGHDDHQQRDRGR
jgi:hypothetical protein